MDGDRRRSELDLVRSSPLFDAEWYAERHPDVALSGLDPALHYVVLGGPLLRDPGPGFDAAAYAARLGGRLRGRNPLVHHERRMARRGGARARAPAADDAGIAQHPGPPAETVERVRLRFAITVAAPQGGHDAGGDLPFAESLRSALGALGHEARIDLPGRRERAPRDVVIALRGGAPQEPEPGVLNLLWIISHPDQVPYEECEAHDAVLAASASHAALLSLVVARPVHVLPRCADTGRLRPRPELHDPRGPALFVGDRHGGDRPLLRWAVEAGTPIEVWGRGWEGHIPPDWIRGEHLPDAALPERRAAARCVLVDHPPAMRDFGIVSGRVLDVLASGGRVVSDRIPSLAAQFGDVATCVEGPGDLVAALRVEAAPAAREAAAARVAERHSFNARAEAVVEVARAHLAGRPPRLPDLSAPTIASPRRRRVGILPMRSRGRLTSSVYIRLLAPLTTDEAHLTLQPIVLDGPEDPRIDDLDACVVQRIPVPEVEDAERLVDRLRRHGTALHVDADDAFGLHETHARGDAALRVVMEAAEAVWFSTGVLAGHYPEVARHARVVPNQLDPRLWRDHRAPPSTAFGEGPLRVLYMGTSTHEGDLAAVRPALEALAAERPGSFELTLIGVTRDADPAPWLRRLAPPPGAGAYPRFVRWLAARGGFDVGVAPLAETPFNAAKSDVKSLDYSALGLLTLAAEGPAYAGRVARGLAVGVPADGWHAAIENVLRDRGRHEPMRRAALADLWTRRSTLVQPHPLVAR